MQPHVTFTEDPATALHASCRFLASDPILHNLILTILHARIAHPEPGRYWIVDEDDGVVGMAVQSPLYYAATLTPMATGAAVALVNAIVDQGIRLPGVNGEVTTAAAFAGQWNERCHSAVTPFQGNRIYELLEMVEPAPVPGELRQATTGDRSLVFDWMHAFSAEIGEPMQDIEARVDTWLNAGGVWLWEDDKPVAMSVAHEPVEGVARISGVYTPPDRRNHGYGSGCVHALSRRLRQQKLRCMLYTDLGNATSNSIYRHIGYRPVAEALRYRFT